MNEGAHRKVKKALLLFLAIVCAVILLVALVILGIRTFNSQQSRIDSDRGVQEGAYIQIGGIEQYMQIRGDDRENPVILWLHGGPGNPLAYLTYYYQRPLEKDYTIAYWEQRGCGRTFYRNEDNGDLTIEQFLADTDEIVDYLCARFGQEKIVIAGQSWGTVLGMEYMNAHPDKVAAYIGVGQIIDFSQGKVHAAQVASEVAMERGNEEDAKVLAGHIEEFTKAKSIEQVDAESLENMVITTLKYLRPDGEMSGIGQVVVGLAAPEMLMDDMRWLLFESDTKSILSGQSDLVNYMYFRFQAESADYCSAFATPFHAPLLQRSMADCHTLTI